MNLANFASCGVGMIVMSEVNRLLNPLSFAADQLAFFQELASPAAAEWKKPPRGRAIPNVKNVGRRLGNPDDSPNS